MSDQELYLDLFLAVSRRATKGNANLVKPVNVILHRYHEWGTSRIHSTLNELISNGDLVRNSQGEYMIAEFLKKSTKTPRELQKARCVYCKRNLLLKQITKDHVIPVSRGGADDDSNIVLCCRSCNELKGDLTPAEWAKSILQYDRPRRYQSRFVQVAQYAAVSILVFVAGLRGWING